MVSEFSDVVVRNLSCGNAHRQTRSFHGLKFVCAGTRKIDLLHWYLFEPEDTDYY